MKRLSYFELLTSNGDETRMTLPLSALSFSIMTIAKLSRETKIENGKQVQKFNRVEDLVKFGKPALMTYLSQYCRYDELSTITQEIEEKLAKLGLKLEGSDFTTGDVSVSCLNLSASTRNLLSKLSSKIKTLDDLSILGAKRISNMLTENKLATIMDISIELEKYGLKLEGSPYRINSEKFFPLTEFSEFLGKAKAV